MKAFFDIKTILIAILSVFVSKSIIFLAVGVLIAIDLATALYCSFIKKERITSKKLSHTVSKAVLYQIFLLTLFIIEHVIFNFTQLGFSLFSLGALYLSLIELKSIGENIEKAIGINLFDQLLKRMKRKLDENVAE